MNTLGKLLILLTFVLLATPGPLLAQAQSEASGSSGLILLFALYVVAIALALVEIFLIPGFGMAGIGSIAALAFCGYQAFALYGFAKGSLITLVLLVLAIVVVVVSIKMMARTEAGRAFVLDKTLDEATSGAAQDKYDPDLWVGRKLKALTDLRPGGKATFEDETVEVFSEGEFLHNGDILEVFKVADGKLMVKKVEANAD